MTELHDKLTSWGKAREAVRAMILTSTRTIPGGQLDLFSDYDGEWVEDMATYPVDLIMPDEAMQATEDIIDNRNRKEFSSQLENIPKQMSNDAYNMLLTTAYYHFQDISRISNEIWEDEACDPDNFEYNISKEPKGSQTIDYLRLSV